METDIKRELHATEIMTRVLLFLEVHFETNNIQDRIVGRVMIQTLSANE